MGVELALLNQGSDSLSFVSGQTGVSPFGGTGGATTGWGGSWMWQSIATQHTPGGQPFERPPLFEPLTFPDIDWSFLAIFGEDQGQILATGSFYQGGQWIGPGVRFY